MLVNNTSRWINSSINIMVDQEKRQFSEGNLHFKVMFVKQHIVKEILSFQAILRY